MNHERNLKIMSLLRIVMEYQDLQDNWDTYGGKPACRKVVSFAVNLLKKLITQTDIPLPVVSPISTGVYLRWFDNDGLLLDIEADIKSVLGTYYRVGLHDESRYYEDFIFSATKATDFLRQVF